MGDAPTLLVIKWELRISFSFFMLTSFQSRDGVIREHLTASHDEEEWKRLLLRALDLDKSQEDAPQSDAFGPQNSANPPPLSSFSDAANTNHSPPEEPPNNAETAQANDARPNNPTSTVNTLLAERRQRLEAQREAQEAAEKAERAERARARREADDAIAADVPPNSKQATNRKYADERRQRLQEARLERERVLRLVENDKLERREKEERRKALAMAEAHGKVEQSQPTTSQETSSSKTDNRTFSARECAIQVRLLDGTTLRSRFGSDQTLSKDVRSWIDSQRTDGDTPYNFKQILTPNPNRTLSISEEEESLASIGLAPSATLVLFPISGYTRAYDAGEPGLLSRSLSAGYGMVSSGLGVVAGTVGSFLGLGATQAQDSQPNAHTPRANQAQPQGPSSSTSGVQSRSTIRVKTLHDQEREERKEQHEFYNGNQVSFLLSLPLEIESLLVTGVWMADGPHPS